MHRQINTRSGLSMRALASISMRAVASSSMRACELQQELNSHRHCCRKILNKTIFGDNFHLLRQKFPKSIMLYQKVSKEFIGQFISFSTLPATAKKQKSKPRRRGQPVLSKVILSYLFCRFLSCALSFWRSLLPKREGGDCLITAARWLIAD